MALLHVTLEAILICLCTPDRIVLHAYGTMWDLCSILVASSFIVLVASWHRSWQARSNDHGTPPTHSLADAVPGVPGAFIGYSHTQFDYSIDRNSRPVSKWHRGMLDL